MSSVQTQRMPQVGFPLDKPFNSSVGRLEANILLSANISTGLYSVRIHSPLRSLEPHAWEGQPRRRFLEQHAYRGGWRAEVHRKSLYPKFRRGESI